jgi:hypothetical protein
MRTQPASFDDNPPAIDAAVKKPSGLPRRIGARILHEARVGAGSGTGGSQTPRWRGVDSNYQYRVS